MLINGDDCLFPATEEAYSYWKSNGSAMGLEPSIGKNYYSREFCTINSAEFRRSPTILDGVASSVSCTPYVNLGILFGNKRSQGNDFVQQELVTPSSITSEFETYRTKLGDQFNESFRTLFIKKRMTSLKSLPNSWALPAFMGGLGIVDRKLTNFEKVWATYWRDHPYDRISLTSIDDPAYAGLSSICAQELKLGGLRRVETSTEWVINHVNGQPHFPANQPRNVLVDASLLRDGAHLAEAAEWDRTKAYIKNWRAIAKRALKYCQENTGLLS